MQKSRILMLCPYPHGAAPSQRFRFEQYIPDLRAAGFEVDQESFLDAETAKILNLPGHTLQKITGVLAGFMRRFALLLRARDYDWVFIHLEASPIGPPIIEAALLALGRKLVYDIDDAIFLSRTQSVTKLFSGLRWRSKVAWTARHSNKVIAVNPYLVNWARQHASDVRLVPTTIDPNYHRPRPTQDPNARPVIGWTGTRTTAPYLDVAREALAKLDEKYDFTFRVICDRDPGFELKHYEFVRWTAATEIQDLWPIDIGIMPVPDEEFARGKVGFKAIQYSAMEIAPVVSNVGSGPEVVEHGKTGLLIENTTEAWYSALESLLLDPERRRSMGQEARKKITSWYAIPVQAERYRALFREGPDPWSGNERTSS